MSRAHTQPGGNVVRLPTAAPRQVKQRCNRAAREQRQILREASPWPGKFMFPSEREAMKRAAQLMKIEQSPAMEIAAAILGVLDDGQLMRVAAALAVSKIKGSPNADQALAVVHSTKMTVGEANDLRNALRRLEGEVRS